MTQGWSEQEVTSDKERDRGLMSEMHNVYKRMYVTKQEAAMHFSASMGYE
jgi:hypothetical protein